MKIYNGLHEDDYAKLMQDEYIAQKKIELEYEKSMSNYGLVEESMSCEEQLIEQASYYENNCFNTYGR